MENKKLIGGSLFVGGLTLAYINRNEPKITEKEKLETGGQLSYKAIGLVFAGIGAIVYLLK
jgi:hypothetical protein